MKLTRSPLWLFFLPLWHCSTLHVENWLHAPVPIAAALEFLEAENENFEQGKSARLQILNNVTQHRD